MDGNARRNDMVLSKNNQTSTFYMELLYDKKCCMSIMKAYISTMNLNRKLSKHVVIVTYLVFSFVGIIPVWACDNTEADVCQMSCCTAQQPNDLQSSLQVASCGCSMQQAPDADRTDPQVKTEINLSHSKSFAQSVINPFLSVPTETNNQTHLQNYPNPIPLSLFLLHSSFLN